MKIACILAAVVLGVFTLWQFNDLSQYGTSLWQGWVLIYGAAALVSLISAFKALPTWFYLVAAVAFCAHAILRGIHIQPERTILFNEDNPAGNETGGLILLTAWFGFLTWQSTRRQAPGTA
jgi:hypothetical protein